MNQSIIGLAILFGVIIISRIIMANALKKLNDESKLKLVNTFSSGSSISLIIIFSAVVLYFITIQYFPDNYLILTIIYLLSLFIYLVFKLISNYQKLKNISISDDYLKSFWLSQIIFFIGFICFFTAIVWTTI